MNTTRREFLLLLAWFFALLGIPAFRPNRAPYLKKGDVSSWLGHCPDALSFIGGKLVLEVLPWDGVGFPCVLLSQGFPGRPEYETVYDFDLFTTRDYPYHFWREAESERYPNVHTYIRMQRFGETFPDAIKALNCSSSERWLAASAA